VLKGWQAAKDAAAKSFENMKGAKLELTEVNYKAVGDVVLGWGTWRMQMTMPGGEVMKLTGRYSDVKAKRDGKWVYIMDHASVPLAPPPDSPEM
jgi:ketosteroid isomerase-like protein